MRRLVAIALKPAIWLAFVLLLAWAKFFRSEVAQAPQFACPTGAAYDPGIGFRPQSTWATVRAVSDDGKEVTIGIHRGDIRSVTSHLELWDIRAGKNQTPILWADPEWQALLSGYPGDTGLMALLSRPAGKEFLSEEAARSALRERLTTGAAKAVDDLRQTVRPIRDDEKPDVFPHSICFGPDGRLIAYVSRNGWPVHLVSESLGDGTIIEDVKTGRRLAMLPGVTDRISLAPGGGTAVSRNIPITREGEQPRLILWDLETSSPRVEFLLPDDYTRVQYSPDGRYVFASYRSQRSIPHMRWWNVATGEQVGSIVNAPDVAFMDGGRVLVIHGWRKSCGVADSYVLGFWDVPTGARIGEWDLGAPSDGGGLIEYLVGSDSGRYLAGDFDPEYGRGRGPAQRVADRLAISLSAQPTPEHKQIILWDVVERREMARLPGRSAAFSQNGRWLAAIDSAGVVRVWEVPTARPWARIVGYAGVATLGCLAGLLFLNQLLRRMRGSVLANWLARGMHGLWSDRRTRRWAAGLLSCAVLVFVLAVRYSVAATRAHADMLAAYEEIHVGISEDGSLTEADVIAMLGRPPDEGPVEEMTCRKKGGGQTGIPTTLRKWTQYGVEMDVMFGEDGKVRSAYISDPLGILEQVATWLGV
jgi:WD40 repeat protein